MVRPFLFAITSGCLCPCNYGLFVSNTAPLRDVAGELIDAHDGNAIQLSNGTFLRFAMGYGKCLDNGVEAKGGCGQWTNNTVGVWMSPSLATRSWSLVQAFTPSDTGWPRCSSKEGGGRGKEGGSGGGAPGAADAAQHPGGDGVGGELRRSTRGRGRAVCLRGRGRGRGRGAAA